MKKAYQGVIRQYRKYLPVKEKYIVTLLEGNTPLLESHRLRKKLKPLKKIKLLKVRNQNQSEG